MTDEEARNLSAARDALSEAEDALRLRPRGRESGRKRLRRYAHNARVEAALATWRAVQSRRSAILTASAAAVLRDRDGDEKAAELYEEMEGAFLDAAEAQEDLAKAAAELAGHFEAQSAGAGSDREQAGGTRAG